MKSKLSCSPWLLAPSIGSSPRKPCFSVYGDSEVSPSALSLINGANVLYGLLFITAKEFLPTTPRRSRIVKNLRPHKVRGAVHQDLSVRCARQLSLRHTSKSSGPTDDSQVGAKKHDLGEYPRIKLHFQTSFTTRNPVFQVQIEEVGGGAEGYACQDARIALYNVYWC